MSSSDFIQRQYEIIQSSYSITQGYERAKADIEAAFRRDKNVAENNWRYTKAKADDAIKPIREAMGSTQNALNNIKWKVNLLEGTGRTPLTGD